MKTQKRLFNLFAALAVISTAAAFAQTPPANDDFANRTVLTGSSLAFVGSLAGATLETGDTNSSLYWLGDGASGSVWWTWTAPASTEVVIWFASPQSASNRLAVYTGTTLGGLTPITYMWPPPAGRYTGFNATAGTTYQIQVIGTDLQPFSAQLTATNKPVFIFQPKDCTVSPYGSAVFSVLASKPPLYFNPKSSYQWYFNGTPIQGQTYASLLIHRVTTNQAGAYSVTASNIGGVTVGGSATLTVTDTNPVPSLAVLPPNGPNLQFNLTGEPGRWYKVESSTNLQSWTNPIWLQPTNPSTLVSVQRLAPTHFVRASLDVPTEVCVAQIKQMNWAAMLWAIDTQQSANASVTAENVMPYLPLDIWARLPVCPEGGTYSFGPVTHPSWCSLGARGHLIPDP